MLSVGDYAPEMEGRSSNPRTWTALGRHTVADGRCGALISTFGGVLRGLTGRTADRPSRYLAYPTGSPNCLARTP